MEDEESTDPVTQPRDVDRGSAGSISLTSQTWTTSLRCRRVSRILRSTWPSRSTRPEDRAARWIGDDECPATHRQNPHPAQHRASRRDPRSRSHASADNAPVTSDAPSRSAPRQSRPLDEPLRRHATVGMSAPHSASFRRLSAHRCYRICLMSAHGRTLVRAWLELGLTDVRVGRASSRVLAGRGRWVARVSSGVGGSRLR